MKAPVDDNFDPETQQLLGSGKPQTQRSPVLGYALVLLGALLFALQSVTQDATLTHVHVPVSCMLFYRGVINTLLSALYIISFQDSRSKITRLTKQELVLLLKVGLAGAANSILYALSYLYIIAGNTAALHHANALFAYIVCYFLYRNPWSSRDRWAIGLSVIGIVFIVHPADASSSTLLGSFLSLLSAFFSALMMIYAKEATTTMTFVLPTVSSEILLIVLTLLFGVVSPGTYHHLFDMLNLPLQLVLVALVGMFVFFGNCAITFAMKYCRADRASLVSIVEIPASYLLAFVILQEKPSSAELCGAVVVMIGTTIICSET